MPGAAANQVKLGIRMLGCHGNYYCPLGDRYPCSDFETQCSLLVRLWYVGFVIRLECRAGCLYGNY